MKINFSTDTARNEFFYAIKNKYGQTWNEIRRIFNLPRATLDGYKSGFSLIPEKLFLEFLELFDESKKEEILGKIERLEDNYGQVKGGKTAYLVNFGEFEKGRIKGLISLIKNQKQREMKIKNFISNLKLTPEICEFVGAFIGDGFFNCYKNNLYQVEFAGDSRFDVEYYTKRIIPILNGVFFNLKPHVYGVKSSNSLRVVFYSKELFYFLKEFFGFIPGKKAHTVTIPNLILENKSFIPHVIRGLFDTDGGIYFDKRKGYKRPYPRIFLQTVSRGLYLQLLEYLSKDFKMYSRFNKRRNIYSIEIYGYNQLNKWMSLIGFSNDRHLRKIATVA